jgi:hypothetical protein
VTVDDVVAIIVVVAVIALILHCPILKPWFGFRKPKDHPGHWFE